MLNILAAVLLFGFIVLVHEFGHFLLAKCSGIGVVEFSVGMGPRIFSVEKGETRYSIKALPFGGSCMMVGEDSENPDPKAFNNKPVLSRIAVIAAGPVFNFILAFLFAMIIVAQIAGTDRCHGEKPGRGGRTSGRRLHHKNQRTPYHGIPGYHAVYLFPSGTGDEGAVYETGERGYGRKRWRDQRICYADPALQ